MEVLIVENIDANIDKMLMTVDIFGKIIKTNRNKFKPFLEIMVYL